MTKAEISKGDVENSSGNSTSSNKGPKAARDKNEEKKRDLSRPAITKQTKDWHRARDPLEYSNNY
jgi:hypothetical protein